MPKKSLWSTDRDLVEGSSHHRNEHVKQDNDSSPVVDAEHDVAKALSEAAVVSRTEFYRFRVFQTEHRPEDRTERVLQTATANGNLEHEYFYYTAWSIQLRCGQIIWPKNRITNFCAKTKRFSKHFVTTHQSSR